MAKMRKPISSIERVKAESDMQERLQSGDISIGQAIREIRQRWLGMRQDQYARMTGVSKNTLGSIERDENRTNLQTLNKVLRPLGYKLTIMPIIIASRHQ